MTISKRTVAALLILRAIMKRRREQRRKKRIWARDWILRRESDDVTQKLIQELRVEDPKAFNEMFRMNGVQFDIILEKIRPMISRQTTHLRKAIPCETRLMITLKYLATGDSFRSLMHFFRVPHNTISGIIPDTCDALYSALNADYLKVC